VLHMQRVSDCKAAIKEPERAPHCPGSRRPAPTRPPRLAQRPLPATSHIAVSAQQSRAHGRQRHAREESSSGLVVGCRTAAARASARRREAQSQLASSSQAAAAETERVRGVLGVPAKAPPPLDCRHLIKARTC
jgi:hypothetical protein